MPKMGVALTILVSSTRLTAAPARVVLDNARVTAWLAGASDVAAHREAAVVPLEETAAGKAGAAFWAADAKQAGDRGPLVLVEPKPGPIPPAVAVPDSATKPGEQPSSGMSFRVLFENDRVEVSRARMDAGAHEAFHTHKSDVVIVHLSGGTIEDTADGKTVAKHWKHGDVEFEARGSSHSARNLGPAVEVVLVRLKP